MKEFAFLYQAQLQLLSTVALAMLLGATIGLDRELADKPAGLRTHILVAGASALLVGLGDVIVQHYDGTLVRELLRSDPIRIIEAVITGVSFLGAGTIIRSGSGEAVQGLTTAASLFVAAALGICVAVSQWVLALGVTVLVLLTLRGLRYVDYWMAQRRPSQRI